MFILSKEKWEPVSDKKGRGSSSAKVRGANAPPPAAAITGDETVVASVSEGSVSSSMVSLRTEDDVLTAVSESDAIVELDSHSAAGDPSSARTLLTPPLPPPRPPRPPRPWPAFPLPPPPPPPLLLLLVGGLDLQSLAKWFNFPHAKHSLPWCGLFAGVLAPLAPPAAAAGPPAAAPPLFLLKLPTALLRFGGHLLTKETEVECLASVTPFISRFLARAAASSRVSENLLRTDSPNLPLRFR